MNIFVTDTDPVISAKNLDDKRVIKMIAESAQLLATALYCNGIMDTPIKPTHINHPVAIWTRTTKQNYHWLLRHFVALCHEKRRRYPENKPHIYEQYIIYLRKNADVLPNFILTPFVNCAANKELNISYKHLTNTHKAYMLYLNDRWDTDKRVPTWYRIEK